MSSQSRLFFQDGDDVDAWFCMLNSMVNFLSAASILATKLEQNYLLSNVTEIRRPAFPLLCGPPQCKMLIEQLGSIETCLRNSTDDVCSLFVEQISASPSQPESEYQGESRDLLQEVRYMNTQDKGDGARANFGGDIECNFVEEQEVLQTAVSDNQDTTSCGDQFEETIKICDSEDTVYFDDFSEPEKATDPSSRKPSDKITAIHVNENVNESPSVETDEYFSTSTSFAENKSVQANNKSDNLSKSSKIKVKSIKSQEIQTNSTSRFKSTIKALITRSPELQKSIKDFKSISCHSPSMTEKTPEKMATAKEKACCKHSMVPKNLNELKEQLDSIKNISSGKVALNKDNRSCKQSSKIPVDKTALKRCKKIEKQPPDTSSCPNNIPAKSPGTSKRFASIESVVKKLIHSSKVTEQKADEGKDTQKSCASMHVKNVNKHEKPDGSRQSITKSTTEHTEKKGHLPKDCKIVKDFIYKKAPVLHKSEKSKITYDPNPCSKREASRKQNDDITQNQSKTTSLRNIKNTSTVEMLKKKEKGCKRAVSPNKVIKEKGDMTCGHLM